ncbi:SDR family oxidoreductase [Flavobacterium sp. CLA17]|uniref:SDR family oxidoreductase n=1 Tax=Flavobacterium sp. CLA17 TaxID=2724135 RepID=UPI001F077AAA|nr:SDR family oxidoreductase [Flavobacterium sp. CLA17]
MKKPDKLAVITGGNSGIGKATAQQLKEMGAQVIITGRRKDAVEKAASELGITWMIADQSSTRDISNLDTSVHEKFGKIDMLLINAGITKTASIESTSEELFDEVMGINFKGAFFTFRKFIPFLNDSASVVFLSSTSARISPASASVYAASKAAVNAVVKIAALELSTRKIRVNAVGPGPIATEIMDKLGMDEKLETQMINSIPLQRFGKPAEVSSLICYLLG